MTVQKNKPKIHIKWKRSTAATKLALGVAVGLSVAALVVLGMAIENKLSDADALREQAAQLEQENDELGDKIDDIGSLEGLEGAAQEEGLENPDTIIITPSN